MIHHTLQYCFKHSLRHLIVTGFSMTALLAVSTPVLAKTMNPEGACSMIYGVQDWLKRDSQLVTIDPVTGEVKPLGPTYAGYDLEGLDFTLDGAKLLASSGDDAEDETTRGSLYQIDTATGAVTEKGKICFTYQRQQQCGKEVSAISFDPNGNLWGWAEECGLLKINQDHPESSQLVFLFTDKETCLTANPAEYTSHVEDMTWDNQGQVLYVANANEVFAYQNGVITRHYPIGANVKEANVETVEMLPDNTLLIKTHQSSNLMTLEPATGEIAMATNVGPYTDIEALAACPGKCEEDAGAWIYAKDSFTDATGLSEIDQITSLVGDNAFEIYGIAVKQDGDTITVAINADMDERGYVPPDSIANKGYFVNIKANTAGKYAGKRHVGFGDFFFNFATQLPAKGVQSNNLYAIHFALGNDSPIETGNHADREKTLGVYKNVATTNISESNYGWSTLNSMKSNVDGNYVNKTGLGEKFSLGQITPESGYFDMAGSRVAPTSILKGTKVADITMLSREQLAATGLDFIKGLGLNPAGNTKMFTLQKEPVNGKITYAQRGAVELGKYTFGFSFKRTPEMVGNFAAHLFTECSNDGMAFKAALRANECPAVPMPK